MSEKRNKKIIRRKSTDPNKYYFTKDTHAAVVEFKECDINDKKRRNQIYVERIKPAFDKIAENLINIHKFTGAYITHEELQAGCTNHLFEAISKFNPEKCTNAFSYFNVVAKRWLIIQTRNSSKVRRDVAIDDYERLIAKDRNSIEERNTTLTPEQEIRKKTSINDVTLLLEEMKKHAVSEDEIKCIDSIKLLIDAQGELDLQNRAAAVIYIRELMGVNHKNALFVISKLKHTYRKLRDDILC